MFGTAGRTMPNVGPVEPVATSAATPGTATSRPSPSKQTVRIRYAPSSPTTCICSWSRSAPREKHLVTKAHSLTPSLSQLRGTTMRAS